MRYFEVAHDMYIYITLFTSDAISIILGVNFSDRWWVRDQVKFDPFQTSERLKTFGDLIFMIFLH